MNATHLFIPLMTLSPYYSRNGPRGRYQKCFRLFWWGKFGSDQWGSSPWTLDHYGGSFHWWRSGRNVPRSSNQKWHVWLSGIYPNFKTRSQGERRGLNILKSFQIFEIIFKTILPCRVPVFDKVEIQYHLLFFCLSIFLFLLKLLCAAANLPFFFTFILY